MINKILNFFRSLFLERKLSDEEIKINRLKSLKTGDVFQIEWSKIKGTIGNVTCLNNSPETEKILIGVEWNNYKECDSLQFELFIVNYSDARLRHFNLLNLELCNKKDLEESNSETINLENQIKEALEKEEYLEVRDLENKLKSLTQK